MIEKIKKLASNFRRKNKYKSFYGQFIKPGDLCFDIGANIGHRTEIFTHLKAKIISVEPVLETYSILKEKFKNNANVTPLQFAIGSEPGNKEIYISDIHEVCTLSELFIEKHTVQQGFIIEWNTKRETAVRTLDQLIDEYGMPSFCKIDIEGYEVEALKGLSQSLPMISLEYTVKLKNLALECIQILSKFNSLSYNFSPYESMEFSFQKWKSQGDFYSFIESLPEKIQTGDIYVKHSMQKNE